MMCKYRVNFLRDGRAPIPESEAISRVMSANKGKNTKPEIILRKALWSIGLRGYRLHRKDIVGRPDIAFLKHKVVIFVHGCFWHRCPYCSLRLPKTHRDFWQKKFERNRRRDQEKEKVLCDTGWKVVIIWECEILANAEECAIRIRGMIDAANEW